MERSSSLPSGGIRPDDLVDLTTKPGPFASAWVELSGTGAWGDTADERRRKNVATGLNDAGAPADLCDAVTDRLASVEGGAHGAVVIGDRSGVLLLEPLPDPPRRELTSWSPRPALSAVLEHRQSEIPAVIVLADRLGANILSGRFGGPTRELTVDGADDPIRKTGQGGWSQARYQTRVEETWEQNARDVAASVCRLADQNGAVTILVGGDVRAVELIVDALPGAQQSLVRRIEHGRAADSSDDLRADEIRTMLRTAVAEETVDLLRTFESRSEQDGTAARGPADTVDAIRRAQVDVLLIHDDQADERTAFVSPESPAAIAMTADELFATGLGVATPARLVDAAICAVLQSGGSVRIVPPAASLDGGMGALLRWETRGSATHEAA